MTEIELQQLRREKWRLDGKAIRTIEQARAFVESVGFCLMYPLRPSIPVPTFIGAFVGSDDRLPTWQHAYSDPRAAEATELMVRLLRERTAYEANLFEEDHTSNNAFLVAASAFPFFYSLVGERNPKHAPKPGSRSPYSALACDAFELIGKDGPISKSKLQEALGGSVSLAALDKALAELLGKLRITRVDYKKNEGSFWDVLYRWAPDAVKEGVNLSVQQALSALLTKYMDCVVAAEPTELEAFFGKFVARSRVKEAVNALLAAREFSFVHVSGRSMLQITPEKEIAVFTPRPPEVRERTPREKTREPFKREPFKKTFTPAASRPERSSSNRPSSNRPASGRPSFDRTSFDRPRNARPRFEKPRFEKPQFEKPQSGRPQVERTESTPPQFMPSADRPTSPTAPSARVPSDRSSANRPSSNRPPSARPPFGRPSSSRSSSGKPVSGKPASDRPRSGRPQSGRPSTGRPSGDRPASGRPSSGRPSSGKPSGRRPFSGRPTTGRP